jgi:hypothetical protein
LSEPGGALLVDERDLAVCKKLEFVAVPRAAPPTLFPRVGLVFLDTATNEYRRYDGTNWAPVTLT